MYKLLICRSFEGWIEAAEKKIVEGYPSPNNMEEATTMVNNCKVTKQTTAIIVRTCQWSTTYISFFLKEWMDATTAQGAALEVGKVGNQLNGEWGTSKPQYNS